MADDELHLTDRDLLMTADGELSARRAARVRAHLTTCWNCRARMAEIEGTIAEFTRAHRQTIHESDDKIDPRLPSAEEPRALLKAQLAELAVKSDGGSWPRFFHLTSFWRSVAYACLALFAAASAGKVFLQHSAMRAQNSATLAIERGAVPDLILTPGATRSVALSDVCSAPHEEVVQAVPAALQQKVFQEYGIVTPRPDDYEIDFLIAPRLGGAEDIRNLWPEPHSGPVWNSYAKDALEDRLHQLVCAGKISLTTAQKEISGDWISAYKKYFHTNQPLPSNPTTDIPSSGQPPGDSAKGKSGYNLPT